jgi:hypothetical protein
MRVVPYQPEHLVGFVPQPGQATDFALQPEAPPHEQAWTALHAEQVLCVGGFTAIWPGRAVGWMLLSVQAGPHMLGLTRVVRRRIAEFEVDRLELYADASFPQAQRWAEMLGFECEGRARNFLPGRRDVFIFARVN